MMINMCWMPKIYPQICIRQCPNIDLSDRQNATLGVWPMQLFSYAQYSKGSFRKTFFKKIIIIIICLVMYFLACWLFTAVTALLQLQWNRATLPCCARALEHRLNSIGTEAQQLHSIWNPSLPGIKPTSLAPEAPGKHLFLFVFLRGPGRLHLHKNIQHWELSIVLNIVY